MTEQTVGATPEQQRLYWTLVESVTLAELAYDDAKERYDAAKVELERLSLTASETAAALVDAQAALEAFVAEYPGISLRAFRPEHIESAFSATVETWEI